MSEFRPLYEPNKEWFDGLDEIQSEYNDDFFKGKKITDWIIETEDGNIREIASMHPKLPIQIMNKIVSLADRVRKNG